MISAAKGAETFYTLENHSSRSEDLETARMLDTKAAEAWVGHPNVDSVRRRNKKYKSNVTIVSHITCQSQGLPYLFSFFNR